MNEASKALAEVRGWLCDNLDASDAGHVCGMLSVVSRRVVQADELESENKNLRGLLRDVWWHMVNAAWHEDSPNPSAFIDRMHELGVEVDG